MNHIKTLLTAFLVLVCCSTTPLPAADTPESRYSPPFDAPLAYPFTRETSQNCGHWETASQDFPYFGAPRDRNKRRHAGIDLYPRSGSGTPVRAIAEGTIIRIAPFYTRASGEVTYGVLIDHGEFVANYAELTKPTHTVGTRLQRGELISRISGTRQLHFELYEAGTASWSRGWYGQRPPNLRDPTEFIMRLLNSKP